MIEFRKINEITIEDKYPMASAMVIFSNLYGAQYFTTLDLKSGFYQIELAERDREKMAWSVNNGGYEFCRWTFGLKNVYFIKQSIMFWGTKLARYNVYIDDVIIYSKTAEDHLGIGRKVKVFQKKRRIFNV